VAEVSSSFVQFPQSSGHAEGHPENLVNPVTNYETSPALIALLLL